MGGLVLRLFVRNLDLMLPKLTRPLLSFNLYSYITFNIYLYNPFLIVLLLEEPWDRSKVFTFHGVPCFTKRATWLFVFFALC